MQNAIAHSAHSNSLAEFSATIPGKITLGIAATAIVAAAAHISFPLWFTPIPFILTPLAVLGVGLAFGPIGGFLVMLAYLAEGAAGLPVFGPQGPGGVAQLLGPTGGFLMAYPLVAAIAGGLTRTIRLPRFAAATIANTAAIAVLFLCGAAWFMLGATLLTHAAHLSASIAWSKAVAPFLPGEAIKILAAAGIYSALYRSTRA